MRTWVCEETGELGVPFCKPSKQLIRKNANAVVAISCRVNGCLCKMKGNRWRPLTPDEASVCAELGDRLCADTFQWIMHGKQGPQPPNVTLSDVRAVLRKKAG